MLHVSLIATRAQTRGLLIPRRVRFELLDWPCFYTRLPFIHTDTQTLPKETAPFKITLFSTLLSHPLPALSTFLSTLWVVRPGNNYLPVPQASGGYNSVSFPRYSKCEPLSAQRPHSGCCIEDRPKGRWRYKRWLGRRRPLFSSTRQLVYNRW